MIGPHHQLLQIGRLQGAGDQPALDHMHPALTRETVSSAQSDSAASVGRSGRWIACASWEADYRCTTEALICMPGQASIGKYYGKIVCLPPDRLLSGLLRNCA